ncbi:MAG: 3-hydroxyacyl-CoA dehydrogenase family protein [Deltaproteobacteria bacterium]|nr:3-hydroxyacyl-CoA dehydrogenase family protein [Deltaproteobacteria bacterium]
MEQVLVVGAGFMGAGIAQVCAQSGYQVHLSDVSKEAIENAQKAIEWSVKKLFQKGSLKDPPADILKRLSCEADLKSAESADWIIEAVLEKEDLKRNLFRELEQIAPKKTPIATNTSSIPITRIATVTKNPERVLGLHFFGPVPFMNLVEVVKGEKTSVNIFEKSVAFIRTLGKTPVRVHRDIPGFVMNRIFSAAFREALDLVADGIVSAEDVDIGMRLGYNWHIGPFEIADNAGLDTFALVSRSMKALGEEMLVSKSDLVESMIQEGRLGRKVGKGFYRYTPDGKRIPWDEKG